MCHFQPPASACAVSFALSDRLPSILSFTWLTLYPLGLRPLGLFTLRSQPAQQSFPEPSSRWVWSLLSDVCGTYDYIRHSISNSILFRFCLILKPWALPLSPFSHPVHLGAWEISLFSLSRSTSSSLFL